MNAARLASAATLALALTWSCGDGPPTVPPDFLFEVSNLKVEPAVGHEGEELVFTWDMVVAPRHQVIYIFGVDGRADATVQVGAIECGTVEACRGYGRHTVRVTSLIDRYGTGDHLATVLVHNGGSRVAGTLRVGFRVEL